MNSTFRRGMSGCFAREAVAEPRTCRNGHASVEYNQPGL